MKLFKLIQEVVNQFKRTAQFLFSPLSHPLLQEHQSMSIEKDIGRMADALEALVALAKIGGAAPGKPADVKLAAEPPKTPAASAPEKPTDTPAAPEATQANAQLAMQALAAKKGRDVVVALLATFDATKVSNLKPEHYANFILKANEKTAA